MLPLPPSCPFRRGAVGSAGGMWPSLSRSNYRTELLICTLLAFEAPQYPEAATAASPHREFALQSQSSVFYHPRQVEVRAVGLVNEAAVYFETSIGFSAFHREGLLTSVVEVEDAHIKAFHMCHHRNSIFYEVLAREGGGLTIFEYNLATRSRVIVSEFQDAAPAASLACVDQMLLRTSASNFMAISLLTHETPPVIIQAFHSPQGTDMMTSLAVGFAADVISKAHVYAAVPGNSTVLQMRLTVEADGTLHASTKTLLEAGRGDDGPLEHANVRQPGVLAWGQGRLLFTDGCSVREVSDAAVWTLLGSPSTPCMPPSNETLEPVPWASRLSELVGLAVPADGTASGIALAVTRAQVVRLDAKEDVCASVDAGDCSSHSNHCGLAESPGGSRCMACSGMERWASTQYPPIELCALHGSSRAGVHYHLLGCGCHPSQELDSGDPGAEEEVPLGLQFVVGSLLVAGFALALLLYRASRRAAVARELEGVDSVVFHTFIDE